MCILHPPWVSSSVLGSRFLKTNQKLYNCTVFVFHIVDQSALYIEDIVTKFKTFKVYVSHLIAQLNEYLIPISGSYKSKKTIVFHEFVLYVLIFKSTVKRYYLIN